MQKPRKQGKSIAKYLETYTPDEKAAFLKIQEMADAIIPTRKKQDAVYPDELKIFAKTLWLKGYKRDTIAEILRVGRTSIHTWINDPHVDALMNKELADAIKSNLVSDLYIKAHKLFSVGSEDERMDKSSTLQLYSSAGIAIDKARMLAGESTQNVAHVHQRRDQFTDQVSEKDDELLKLEAEIALLEE